MKSQKQMYATSRDNLSETYKHFNEIQTGPNPLTPEEIDRLIARRPEFWARFQIWGTKGKSTEPEKPE